MKKERLSYSDEKSVLLLTMGDKKAFEKLYLKYKENLCRYCFSIISDSGAAEDLVQDAFIKVWENRESIYPDMSFSSFIFTLVHNNSVSYIRKHHTEQIIINKLYTEYSTQDESILSGIISGEYELFFDKITENLPPKRKLTFLLSREKGLSHKEIAKQLGISINTVQEHISETLRYFKSNLMKHPDLRVILSNTPKSRNVSRICRSFRQASLSTHTI